MTAGPLTLDDIADLRAYERERDAFRAHVIALKRLRRVALGDIITVVFEHRDTIRFQVQEMARAERLLTDEQVQTELDVYNPLVPGPGRLTVTCFVELTSEEHLREWLPKLVGLERAFALRLGESEGDEMVRGRPEEAHEAQLTREDVTASVHYVTFAVTDEQVDRLAAGPAVLVVDHPEYHAETTLSDETRASLVADLR